MRAWIRHSAPEVVEAIKRGGDNLAKSIGWYDVAALLGRMGLR